MFYLQSTLLYISFRYIVFPSKLTASFTVFQRDSDFRSAYFRDHQFHVLDVAKLEFILVRSQLTCAHKCLRDPRCFSTNLAAKPEVNGDYVCELLPTDRYNASDSFRRSPHSHHYSVKTLCLSNPCQFYRSCRALYQVKDFWSGFLPNNHGNYCEKWLVEVPTDVCMYGKGNRPGKFFTPIAGKIYFIKLVHISGIVGCTNKDESLWGCKSHLHTILTDKDDNTVFPEDRIARKYKLSGFTKNSNELVFTFTTPLMVTAGQEYRVWYLQDLNDKYESNNNPGPSCMKVIYLFSK
ncbi:uncharacterized protein LOC111326661 [Stylophora pistillata]|uniref:uncharacterized protein LOC111326661 n=1 Tax=Stylophora pistillata TaxID=50429 RepID=UPI000C03D62C|nr:uncharacterized protein LOC111326661 [Stylophora pistillata]